ncbi:hypothetical protein GCM10009808_19720 [Microbacterium sediminicola]|uniref:Aminoglycoside phosphotransferase domain-containing protein n=1 Tax=Microbacterium sediminicola TaxID=415210 RepID=A0ABP4UDN1_9MICO
MHALLTHLADAGAAGVPRVVGATETEEVLTFLPGATPVGDIPDTLLAEAAGWLRGFHDAVRDWDPGPRQWRQTDAAPEPGQIICHNDPGVYNWVIRDGHFAGMIDWDQAGPGDPIHDVAFLCWSGVPLRDEFDPSDAARRVNLVAAAYGDLDPAALLDAVGERIGLSLDRIQAGIDRGDPGMLALERAGVLDTTRAALARFRASLPGIRAAL